MSSVTLGGIPFQGWEVPNTIPFGLRQSVVVHRLIGGARVVDAMGPDPKPISWSGRFRGPGATSRALLFRSLAAEGAQLDLTWGGLAFAVVITDYEPRMEREFEIPYSMTVEIVDDLDGPVGGLLSTLDSLVSGDLFAAVDIVAGIASDTVQSAVSAISDAVSVVGVLQDASISAISAVADTVAIATDAIDGAISDVTAAFSVLDPLSGDPDEIAAWLIDTTTQAADLAGLTRAEAYVGRIAVNLSLGAA